VELAELISLGDHPALSFLNSTAMPPPDTIELIGEGGAYLSWLEQAGLISGADRELAARAFGADELDAVAAEAVRLREWLRPVVAMWAAAADGPALPAEARGHLNEILALGRRFLRLEAGANSTLRASDQRSWDHARQLLVPPAEAAAYLLAGGEPQLVRHCEGPACTLWFYDRTKSRRRRWCSMAACGNREKARKHRERGRMAAS
jgi:predicted RNA-binding Zn ribbon-like protein